MTTYSDAANQGYNSVLTLWNSGGFAGEPDAFWLSGNTLRTVILYKLVAGVQDTQDFFIAKRVGGLNVAARRIAH